MSEIKRETIGKMVSDLKKKEPETRDPIEIGRAASKSFEKVFMETLDAAKKEFIDDFYIEVITTKDRILDRVIRNRLVARRSCPTPTYDHAVYKYHHDDERIEFLWVVPAKDICSMFKEHALEIVKDERELRDFALDFLDGTLLKRCKQLNGEKSDSNILENV